jgi:hypothetical protein
MSGCGGGCRNGSSSLVRLGRSGVATAASAGLSCRSARVSAVVTELGVSTGRRADRGASTGTGTPLPAGSASASARGADGGQSSEGSRAYGRVLLPTFEPACTSGVARRVRAHSPQRRLNHAEASSPGSAAGADAGRLLHRHSDCPRSTRAVLRLSWQLRQLRRWFGRRRREHREQLEQPARYVAVKKRV